MLSGETTIGKYPVECVETINRIAKRMESEDGPVLREDLSTQTAEVENAALLSISCLRARGRRDRSFHAPRLACAKALITSTERSCLRIYR